MKFDSITQLEDESNMYRSNNQNEYFKEASEHIKTALITSKLNHLKMKITFLNPSLYSTYLVQQNDALYETCNCVSSLL